MEVDTYLKWIQLIVNAFALGAAGWIYKAYIQNLKSALSSKDEQINIVERNMDFMKDKITDLEKKTPEFMEKILNERIKIREDEILRLSNDKDKNKEKLEIKNQELLRLISELEKTKDVKKQLSFVGDDFDDYFFSRQGNLEIEEMGMVAVYSGQLMITDPCYVDSDWMKEKFEDLRLIRDKETGNTYQFRRDFNNYEEKLDGFDKTVNQLLEENKFEKIKIVREMNYSYAGASAATLSDLGYGELKFKTGTEGAGLAFGTAFGDGMYPVYGEKYDGKIIRVYVNVL